MKGRPVGPCPRGEGDPGVWAVAGKNASQGHTAAKQALASVLERIAAFHDDLARTHEGLAVAYRDLAEVLPDGLAAVADPSLYVPVIPPPEPRPAFITQGEVAEMLQCDARTVRRLELEGEIPSPIGAGRRKRWRTRDIERLVEGDDR